MKNVRLTRKLTYHKEKVAQQFSWNRSKNTLLTEAEKFKPIFTVSVVYLFTVIILMWLFIGINVRWNGIRFVAITVDCISKSLSLPLIHARISLVQLTQFFAKFKFNTNFIRHIKHFRRLDKIDSCDNKIVWHRTKIIFFSYFSSFSENHLRYYLLFVIQQMKFTPIEQKSSTINQ